MLATDFDHHDPALHADPEFYLRIDELRARHPIGYSTKHGGFWFATTYSSVLRVWQDRSFISSTGVSIPRWDTPPICPVEVDLPRQRVYRRDVNPFFTPEAVQEYEDGLRRVADRILDDIVPAGQCDIATDYARKLPPIAFFEVVLQRPVEELSILMPISHTVTYEADPKRKGEAIVAMMHYCEQLFAERAAAERSDDMLDACMHLECEEVPFDDWLRITGFSNLIQGGLGTSANAIGNIVRLLVDHPAVESRIRMDRSLIPALIEESLRLNPPLNFVGRGATVDSEVGGQVVRAGEKILLVVAAANRDPDEFPHPTTPDLDRPQNRHLAFGAGMHRCIGSNFARLQVRVAIDALLDRIENLRIPDGAIVEYYSSSQRGPSSFPLTFRDAGSPPRA